MAEDVLTRTLAAIEDVEHDPSRTFEEAELILPTYLTGNKDLWEKRVSLMRRLAGDLTNERLAERHAAMVDLLIKLFDGWPWQQVCDFGTQSIPYKDGLAAGEYMVPFNKLMLCLLEKATRSAADAAHAASMLETMQALVRLWLCTSDTGIATQASALLLDLLKIDAPASDRASGGAGGMPAGGQGLVWKRIFGDKDVYSVFFEACSLASKSDMSKSQKTIAQARLMEWLPKVGAMNWGAVSRSHHRDIETQYSVQGGLLDFAALKMVDFKDDVLMHRCLVDFFSDLLNSTRPLDTHTMTQHDSVGLQYLIMHGLHVRTAAIYMQLPGSQSDPVEAMFLYGPAANYVATYASCYPDHFLASQMPKQVNERLMQTLDMSPGKWAHADSPKHDLHLAASLPRRALLPSGDWHTSPLSLVPSRATNPDALNTLATIFEGPERKAIVYPPTSPLTNGSADIATAEEGAAARALYFNYLADNPRFWHDITTHADTVALKELALAAIRCLTSVIMANWSTNPDLPLPATIATPESGHLAILSPPALEYTLPYLLKPAQTFANLVGGRGDSESSAYKIAAAKFDALRALNSRLMVQVEQQPGEGYEDILATISKRLAEGPLSREGEVGGRIGTLEL
ncbi:hypothetical protein LTR36_006618 [Oleoguttula mirabilis]|uniref:Uncharacterized protein n=1 Tax=Oleoguttula mirabilis TaxID=1507867 RepID=A0AAV9JCA5_9PEZI|nr:hypothetical protein LTR36_006618 [Oleoguttula mirabilis]